MQAGGDDGIVFDLPGLLDHIRSHYLDLFEKELRKLRRWGRRIVPEFALERDGQIIEVDGFAGTRCDALVLEKKIATPTFLPLDSLIDFPRVEFDVGGMPVWIAPMHWYGVNVTISGDTDVIRRVLESWFASAFHSKMPNWEENLKYAVHDISDVSVTAGVLRCKIDFGTAQASSAMDLLAELQLAGATNVAFGFDGHENNAKAEM